MATLNLKIISSKLIIPSYKHDTSPPSNHSTLSVFDNVTENQHIAIIFAYSPPTPPNTTLELGLRKALAVYREFAGRLKKDCNGNPIILLNDKGAQFIEAIDDNALDPKLLSEPSTSLLSLHPMLHETEELLQVQVTRFSCGTMVLGFSTNHMVADANATCNFLIAWGQACRGVDISPIPLLNRMIFSPRDPLRVEFEHREVEYITKKFTKIHPIVNYRDVKNIILNKVSYELEFLKELKAKASLLNRDSKPFSTFESLVAHLWRVITKARGLKGFEGSKVKIAVDGRARLNPRVPREFFGNVVLWAYARDNVADLLNKPLSYAARVMHESIVGLNDRYFKSFVDFSSGIVKEEYLVPRNTVDAYDLVLCPDLEINSWLRFQFYDLDFGSGYPDIFMPSYLPIEGMVILLPSVSRDGSVDVFVPLFQESSTIFKQMCKIVD